MHPDAQRLRDTKERIDGNVHQTAFHFAEILRGQLSFFRESLLSERGFLAMTTNGLAQYASMFPDRHRSLREQEGLEP